MKKIALAAMILTLAAVSGSASARTFTIHGTICRPIFANRGAAEYTQYGVHNTSTTDTLTLECPLPITRPESGPPPAVNFVQVTVYDRSSTADVSCLLEQVDMNGKVTVSLFNKTFGLGPGTGPIDFPFSPDGDFPGGADAGGSWRFRCVLPPVDSGWFSHLTSILVQTSE